MVNYYLFQKQKFILVSDWPISRVKRKYGHSFEILTTIKDKTNIDTISQRIARQYPKFELKTSLKRCVIFTTQIREKIRQKKLGKARCEVFKKKMRARYRGISIFQGHRHTEAYKKFMSNKMKNNSHNKGLYWIYNPYTDEEKRIRDRTKIPEGFRFGRNPSSTEHAIYNCVTYIATKFPKDRRSRMDL